MAAYAGGVPKKLEAIGSVAVAPRGEYAPHRTCQQGLERVTPALTPLDPRGARRGRLPSPRRWWMKAP